MAGQFKKNCKFRSICTDFLTKLKNPTHFYHATQLIDISFHPKPSNYRNKMTINSEMFFATS